MVNYCIVHLKKLNMIMVLLQNSSIRNHNTVRTQFSDLIIFLCVRIYAIFFLTLNAYQAIIFETLILSRDFAKSGTKMLNNLVIWQKVINLSVLEVYKLIGACRIIFISREDFCFLEKVAKRKNRIWLSSEGYFVQFLKLPSFNEYFTPCS